MELKELCKTIGVDRETDWHTAKYIAVCATLERSEVSASVVYSALKGTQVIDIADRQAIVEGLRNAKNYGEWRRVPVTMGMIDWREPEDTRNWTEKTADYQRQLHANFIAARGGQTQTRDSLEREERARRAYIAAGGQ